MAIVFAPESFTPMLQSLISPCRAEERALDSQSLVDADSEVVISSRRPLSLLASVFFHADAAAKQRSLFAPKELFHTLSKLHSYSDQQHIQIMSRQIRGARGKYTWILHARTHACAITDIFAALPLAYNRLANS